MTEIEHQTFLSPTRGVCRFGEVVADIIAEAKKDAARPLRISVGTDSEEIGIIAKYVAIVHLWRVGRGARAYRMEVSEPILPGHPEDSGRFRHRIWSEVLLTATLAQELRSALRDALDLPLCEILEVHADVGEHGRSSTMIREVIGMLKGYGFSDELIKLKPEAYAASAVADHYI